MKTKDYYKSENILPFIEIIIFELYINNNYKIFFFFEL